MASLRVERRAAAWCAVQRQLARVGRFSARLTADLGIWADVRAFPPLAVCCGLNCVGGLALARRLAATQTARMSAIDMVVAATAAAILAFGARMALARVEAHRPAVWLRGLASFACSAPIVLLFVAPHARLGGMQQAYLAMLAVVCALIGALWSSELTDRLLSAGLSNAARERQVDRSLLQISAARQAEQAGQKAQSLSGATLRIERRRLGEGIEQIEGVAVAEFSAGQALAAVHVSFCPSLPQSPNMTFQALGETADQVRIKAAGVFPWGCRFELKRTGDMSIGQHTEIAFRAESRQPCRSAA